MTENVLFEGDCKALYLRLKDGMNLARKKHPFYAEGKYQALGVIGEEYREFVQAIEKESDTRSVEEAWDVVFTCLRFIIGEHRTPEGKGDGFGWERRS